MNYSHILNGRPDSGPLPAGAVFVGMEIYPNGSPRYGKLAHPWFNKPCYENPPSTGDGREG